MNVNIRKYTLPALIDTGASISCISHSLYRAVCKEKNFETEKCKVKIFLADGSSQCARVKIRLPIVIESNTYMHVCHVVPRLNRAIILGVDFLKKSRANISFDNMDKDVLTIRAKTNFSIPPNSECCVAAMVLSDKSMHKTIGVTENLLRNKSVPFCVKRGIVKPDRSSNDIPLVLFNTSHKSYQVKKDSILGLYSLRVEEDFMGPDDLKEVPVQAYNEGDFKLDKENLSEDQISELTALLERNSNSFIINDDGLGLTTEYTHRIDLKKDYKPINIMAYRTSPGRAEIMDKLLEGQERAGVIERCPGHTEWCSPAFLVEKGKGKNGKRSFRIVVDFRHLNQQIKNQAYNFPRIDDTLNKVGGIGAKYYSTLDAYSGFFQIPLRERDRNMTAFATPGKTWRYRTMPMGLSTSPKAFHNVIENVIRHLPTCLPYVDDIIVASPSWDDHLTDLNELFKAFRKANIKFKKPKCSFGYRKIPFLGFVVSEDGIYPNPEKVELIKNFPVPKTPKQVKSFNGLATYYQAFIPHFSSTMQPLYTLTKRNAKFHWTETHQQAFDKIKMSLAEDVVLKYPNFSKPFTIATDSSKYAVGACISQLDCENNLRPVAFAGRKLSTAERNYSVTDQELVGIKFALMKFEHYVIGRPFTILTDHAALVALNGKVKLTGRMQKWAEFFGRFDFTIKHLKGKLNVVPDALSRIPYTDIVEENDRKPFKTTRFNSVHSIKYFNQDDYLENYPIRVYKPRSIMKKKCNVNAVTRAQSKRLAEESMDSEDHNFDDLELDSDDYIDTDVDDSAIEQPLVKHSKRPVVTSSKARKQRTLAVKLCKHDFEQSAFKDIIKHYQDPFSVKDLINDQQRDHFCSSVINYIEKAELPVNNRLARAILLTHDHFFIKNDVLYRYSGKLSEKHVVDPQIVLPNNWIPVILANLHDTPSGAHVGITKLTSVIKPRYYWPTMTLDIYNHVNTCDKCLKSKYVKNPLTLPMTLHDKSPSPFAHLMIDTVGPIHPTKHGNRCIQVVVDVYSRFIIAWPTRNIKSAVFTREFFNNVICQYGLPQVVYSDNGTTFKAEFAHACNKFGIENRYGTPYQSRSQGLVERANQSVVQALRTFTNKMQDNWCEYIRAIIFGLNVSSSYSLGYSPYLLLYGRNARLPPANIFAELDSEAIPVQDQLVKIIKQQDNLIEEIEKNFNTTQSKMKQRWDKGKKYHTFEVGQLVYVKNKTRLVKDTSQKLQALYSGPYMIVQLPTKFTAKLRVLETGKTIQQTVHVERLKRVNFKKPGASLRIQNN